MTVRCEGRDERSQRGGGLILPPTMAILTRHAVEAFPAVDMGASRCPLAKSSHSRSMSQQFDVADIPRLRTLTSSTTTTTTTTSPMKEHLRSSACNSSFETKGPTWVAATMLQSNLLVEVADMSFHLHKFPLLSRSGRLNRLVFESRDTEKDHIKLDNMPGGPGAFELCIKFCYGIPIMITRSNVAALRCATEYLEMTEELEANNLVSKTEDFLSSEIFTSWCDSIAVLRTCAALLPWAETLQIVKMCSESIAWKACTDPRGIRWSYSSAGSESPSVSPGGGSNSSSAKSSTSFEGVAPVMPQDWWFADVVELDLRSFKVVVEVILAKGMRHDMMGSAVLSYAHRWIPTLTESHHHHQDSIPHCISPTKDKKKNKVSKLPCGCGEASQAQERAVLEGIVELLPPQKDSVPVSGLLRLLRVAILFDASAACRKKLENLSGMQLDQATLADLLIPSCPFRSDTFYDVGAVHRCLDHFLVQDHIQTTLQRTLPTSSGRDKNGDVYDTSHLRPPGVGPHTAKMKVAKLMDSYLAEIARDCNLTFAKFQALAEALPEFSRITDDGLYRAVDTFLKAHPGLSELERKKLCRMMDCQRLSLEACMHAAQNERLPLRIVVQVLFSEQLKLRNAISGSSLARVKRSLDLPQPQPQLAAAAARLTQAPAQDGVSSHMDIRALQQDVLFMKAKFAELQKDYTQVTQQVEKLTRQKGSWVKRLFQSKDNAESLTSASPAHPRWSRPWRNSIS